MKRALLLTFLAAAAANAQTTVIRAARMFDGRSDSLVANAVVVVEGTKIVRVGGEVPAGAKVIDLGDRTLMPGLIDAHTHIALHSGDYDEEILREPPETRAIIATANARKTLEAGITTIRDLGNEGAGLADVALRDAINKGIVPGPRIVAAIRPVVTTGGYRLTGYASPTPPIAQIADGVAEARRAVRQLVADGADVIKVYLDSAEKRQTRSDILSGAIVYSQDELNAITEEAHHAGIRVASHTYSDEAARMGVAAGVDSIEHGLYLTDETFRAMAQRGIVYVPTLLVYEAWRDGQLFGGISPANKVKLTKTVELHNAAFKRALASGVKIAFGTDTFEQPGTNAQELQVMVREGMRPIDALRSATSVAAALLGLETVTGTIEAGKSADLIAVAGDPLRDVATTQHPLFVMKEGAVVVAR